VLQCKHLPQQAGQDMQVWVVPLKLWEAAVQLMAYAVFPFPVPVLCRPLDCC
jgi:hypothetical protein